MQLENVRVFCFMLVDYDCYKIMGPLCTNYLLKPCNEVVCFVANVLFGCCFVSSDRRLADHFGGKLHLGYMQIREKLAELQVSLCNFCPTYESILALLTVVCLLFIT